MDTKYKLPNIWSHIIHVYRRHAFVLCIFGLNIFFKDKQKAYCLLVVLKQIYMRDIHGILQNVHICQHKKSSNK